MEDISNFLTSPTRSALAIFCRAPRMGTVKTRLASTHGDEFALHLYRAMLADSFALGRKLAPAVDTFACFTPSDALQDQALTEIWDGPGFPQCEGDLGTRMLNCFAQLRSQGYEKIVLIGSDSPDVPLKRLQRAFEVLDALPLLVFGPAPDGGFYLIGASLEVPGWLFEGVEWSSSTTLEKILWKNATHKTERMEWARLPRWRDVDDEADLRDLKRRLSEVGTTAPHTREFLKV